MEPKTIPIAPQQKPVSFVSIDVFKASLKGHEANNFIKFVIDLFGIEVASHLVSRYFIGTPKHWPGATVFWQIDTRGKIRTGKIMLYNHTTGKRVKEPYNHINWAHTALKQSDFELRQCLFGEHLLIDKTKPVAIVESEKTAVIASNYLPQWNWLALGSLNNLNAEKCSILKGRNVTLFPDLNGFHKWSVKAQELSHITNFQVSDLLERKATDAERKQGLDLADYLIKFKSKDFTIPDNLPHGKNFYSVYTKEEEQAVLTEVSRLLHDAGISFSRVGVEILCSPTDETIVGRIYRSVLYSN